LSLVLTFAGACSSPQQGPIRDTWCSSTATADVLDDREDGDVALCAKFGVGKWRVVTADGVATTPVAGGLSRSDDLPIAVLPADRASTRALHFQLKSPGFPDTSPAAFASLQVDLKGVDLSRYASLRFWTHANTATKVRVNLGSAATTASSAGGTCDSSAGLCGDHYGLTVDVAASLAPTSWDQVDSIALSGLTQEGWGQTVPVNDLAHATSLEFRFSGKFLDADRWVSPEAFDVWIDDIELIR